MHHPASFTAYQIAVRMMDSARDPQLGYLIPTESQRLMQHTIDEYRNSVVVGDDLLRPVRMLAHKVDMAWSNRRGIDGIQKHYIMRKLAIEQEVRRAIKEDHVTQVVMVRAGFDPLFARLQKEFPQVQFFELGHPITQDIKKRAFAKAAVNEGPHFHNVAFDMDKDRVADVLGQQPAYRSDQKTAFVAEGITMYMDQPRVGALLDDMQRMGAEGSSVIVGAANADMRKGQFTLHKNSEEMKFSIAMADMPEFAHSHGFRVRSQAGYARLQQPIDTPEEQARLSAMQSGENYFVLTRGADNFTTAPFKPAPIQELRVSSGFEAPAAKTAWAKRISVMTPQAGMAR